MTEEQFHKAIMQLSPEKFFDLIDLLRSCIDARDQFEGKFIEFWEQNRKKPDLSRCIPVHGDVCYMILFDASVVKHTCMFGSTLPKRIVEFGNCFWTREEAQYVADNRDTYGMRIASLMYRLNLMPDMTVWNPEPKNRGWSVFHNIDGRLSITQAQQDIGGIRLRTRKLAEWAIEALNADADYNDITLGV